MKNCGGIPELIRFNKNFLEYKFVVYSGFNCEIIMHQGHVDSEKRINFLFYEITRHNHVISNLTWTMANDTFASVLPKVVHMALNTLANRHVVTVRYVLLVYVQGLESPVTCAADTLGIRHASITTKGKREVRRRGHVKFVSIAVRAEL